ncbi:MAG: methionyl-tRNA formyltransferase [Gaiellaceae bacterium]
MAERLAVAATAPFGAGVLEGLAARREISFLITRPDRPAGRGQKLRSPAAKLVAERLGIPVLQPEKLDASFELDADTVILAAYGVLIPEAQLERALWLNVHPSLLPRWRGAAPVERALMAGDPETGVTIHRTVKELDAGPICAQAAFPLALEDDAGSVYEKTAALAVTLLDGVLPEPVFEPQPEQGAVYAAKITPEDRELDWSRPPEETLNRIRALSPHIGARGELDGRRLIVWRARPAGPDSALVAGGLELLELQPEGKKRMAAADYLRGLRQ